MDIELVRQESLGAVAAIARRHARIGVADTVASALVLAGVTDARSARRHLEPGVEVNLGVLVAYASGDADAGSQARRMSLSRALVVRGYLLRRGVEGARLDVKALGNRSEGGPADRVDVILGDQ
jgi:hypothetical protein